MNNQQRGPQGKTGGGGQGSVRQARERMEAEQRANLQAQPQSRTRPQMPAALTETRTAQGSLIGVAISRPTQVPQWPLADGSRNMANNTQYEPPAGRANPPQRPPRPSRVPSILDGSKLQDPTPSFQYKPQPAEQPSNARDQGRLHPEEVTSPMSPTSRQSTNSSIGTIPDFPVPMFPPASLQPPTSSRKNNGGGGLGPPPTRRGTSSYYSQTSLVSPIPEESQTSDKAHDSYASSAAIPVMWNGDSSRLDDYDDIEDNYEGRGYGSGYWPHETIEEGRESRESNLDDSDDRGLIRSASVGKRARPSVVTTKSVEKLGQRRSPDGQQKSQSAKGAVAAVGAVGAAAAAGLTSTAMKDGQRETVWPMMGIPDSPLASGTGLIDSTSSSSENVSQLSKPNTVSSNDQSVSPMQSAASSQERDITPTVNRRISGLRRPRNLDMDAVRDAEARGSLTSLPDLIRRATRLAAMMDRGKRPGSRLNDLSDFPTAAEIEKSRQNGPQRQSTLSGMLAAFPPPGLATPTHPGSPQHRNSSWPSPGDDSTAGLDEKDQRRRRRCCGLPMWGFCILLLVILIIIAAAIVVPLELLVLQKKRAAPSTTSAAILQQCQSEVSTECKNGGSSVLSDGNCSCICINGFTGPTCTVGGSTGCTTTSISTLSDVTLGYSIPRLLSDAQANFSIPLDPSRVLARFNSANLSCISENALVTFDGRTGADSSRDVIRSKPTTTTTDESSSTSSNVISTTSDFFSTPFNSTSEVKDFARVAVLFLLQENDLNTASNAQSRLQTFFVRGKPTNEDALNVTLGTGNSANLVALTVQLSNGTTFGGIGETASA